MSLAQAHAFWHALGFPVVDNEEQVFTEVDLQALSRGTELVRAGYVDEAVALSLTRAFARSTDRLAVWQTQLIAEAMADEHRAATLGEDVRPPEIPPRLFDLHRALYPDEAPTGESSVEAKESREVPDFETAQRTARKIVEMADSLEPLLVYSWRRHLAASVGRLLADADPERQGSKLRSVGFADLVNFSSLVRKLSERDIARLVQRFESLVHDIITAHGGRLIKTVGDEVLFTTMQAAPAAAIALDLVDSMSSDDLLPSVRVGMARGEIVSRLGDVFGTTVNRAARLTAIAQDASVLVDATMARDLAELTGFELRPLRRRHLRGVGTVYPSSLRRAGDSKVFEPFSPMPNIRPYPRERP